MRIDRELFGHFAETVKQDEFVASKIADEDFATAEEYIREHIFDKPEAFYSLGKLRRSIQLDRRLSLREILEYIFGHVPRLKPKDELLEEEFAKFVAIYKPDAEAVLPLKNFMKSYITGSSLRDIIEHKEYARLATNPAMADFKALTPAWRNIIPEYVKDYVPLNTYM